MAVRLAPPPPLAPIAGVRLATAAAGVRKAGREDLVLLELAVGSTCAAVFTQNAFCAAPVTLAKRHLAGTAPRYLLINSGNANAGTGAAGIEAALACCAALAGAAGCPTEAVLPFSTGVIGEPLPVERITAALPALHGALAADAWNAAAQAIMTTDTVAKGSSVCVSTAAGDITVTGIAKGSGMIHPNMATMLAYVATDAAVPRGLLQRCLERAVAGSFNAITVDGDTSTNDACVLMATGQGPVRVDDLDDAAGQALQEAVEAVCRTLAQAIVRDGEGATKFITVRVGGGRDTAECRQVAYAIARSPLVKTAFFASDPNWGRILAAIGYAGVPQLAIEGVTVHLGDTCIVRGGARDPDYTEAQGQAVMAKDEITVQVALGRGPAEATVWTCDFSYDYVRINAEYRS
ncbi:bifunctional glutamate N-acetyltransferase/amino-acid acetyltransferase ArgJ [Immundisolibacter sp.]|uniref:bifunctional glutamate N-acetyltransferase/amino-acid acetyltransferase ArgJ n=1 Tax=Immundisolibacter sp. TaxID=1934948 RepID=UPI002601C547|nr:bifunctional glutamate N-acetyltransferase/amino-acid acetyltransferase ArgJ [Immundisolibacter sp.]